MRLPEGWRLRLVGEVCRIEKDQGTHNQLPYVGLEDIEPGTGRFVGSSSPTSVKSSTFRFANNTVLFGRLRPYLRKAFIPDFEGHCSTEIFPLRPSPELASRYLLHWLLMDDTIRIIDATSTGARMPRANMDSVLGLEIPLPPLPEQRRIVAILDEAFEAIATAKANTEKNLQNAREVFAAERVSVFAAGNTWPIRMLPDLAQNLDSKRVPITKSDRKAGEYPYYGASGIVDYIADYIFDGDTLLVSEDGANLLARTSPIAFSVSGRYWVNNHAHILKFKDMATQQFVEFFLESIPLDEYITGAAQPKLNQKALNSIPISIPDSVEEQRQVVARLETLAGETESLQGVYELKLTALAELKQSLLHQAFTGQLTAKATDQQVAEVA